jgi:hypothetical protein
VARARLPQSSDLRDDLRRRRLVIEGVAACENAAVEHATSDHGDSELLAERQELGGRGAVERGVPAGDEEAVGIGLAGEAAEYLG